MKAGIAKPFRMERVLAGLLQYGTGLASAMIAMGLVLVFVDSRAGTHDLAIVTAMRIVTAGILLFILLPALRVLLMLVIFLRQRDYRFGVIAALVLMILFFGFVIGARLEPAPGALSNQFAGWRFFVGWCVGGG